MKITHILHSSLLGTFLDSLWPEVWNYSIIAWEIRSVVLNYKDSKSETKESYRLTGYFLPFQHHKSKPFQANHKNPSE